MSKRETKKDILDAAELLFSQRSYVDVTFRHIADQAKLHVSQIVYHFKNKELLLHAVVNRRAGGLNEERLRILEAYEQVVGRENMQLEPIIRAFLDPYLKKRICGDDGWKNYGALVAKIIWDPLLSSTMSEAYDPVARRYIAALKASTPTLGDKEAHRGFQFLLACMFSAGANNSRVRGLSDGRYSGNDVEAIYEVIVPFVVGGFRAIEKAKPDTGPAS